MLGVMRINESLENLKQHTWINFLQVYWEKIHTKYEKQVTIYGIPWGE